MLISTNLSDGRDNHFAAVASDQPTLEVSNPLDLMDLDSDPSIVLS